MIARLALTTVFLLVAVPAHAQDATLVSIAVTPSGDGILTVPVGGDAAFSVAVLNFGTESINAVADVQFSRISDNAAVPAAPADSLTFTWCGTDPMTGHCAFSLFLSGGGHLLPSSGLLTASVFIHANKPVPDNIAGEYRIVVTFSAIRFITTGLMPERVYGAPRTATSVTVQTQPQN